MQYLSATENTFLFNFFIKPIEKGKIILYNKRKTEKEHMRIVPAVRGVVSRTKDTRSAVYVRIPLSPYGLKAPPWYIG